MSNIVARANTIFVPIFSSSQEIRTFLPLQDHFVDFDSHAGPSFGAASFISFGNPFQVDFRVPVIVMFFSRRHSTITIEVKQQLREIFCPFTLSFPPSSIVVFTKYSVNLSLLFTQYLSVPVGFPAYGSDTQLNWTIESCKHLKSSASS